MHKSKIEGVMIIDHCSYYAHNDIVIVIPPCADSHSEREGRERNFTFKMLIKNIIVIWDNRITLSPEKIYDV